MDKIYNNLLASGCSTNDSESIKDKPDKICLSKENACRTLSGRWNNFNYPGRL